MLVDTTTYVGPARVIESDGTRVRLAVPGQEVRALLALPCHYEPSVDDTVLAVGQGEDYYVIGVLHGTGKTTIDVPGDLSLRAPSGAISLFSTRQIRVEAPRVTLKAAKLSIIATSIREKFTRACRWVHESLKVQAGRMRTIAEEEYEVTAGRIVERASADVRIDGEEINIG